MLMIQVCLCRPKKKQVSLKGPWSQGHFFALKLLAFPSPGDLPDPGIKPRSPALQADTLPSEPNAADIRGSIPGLGRSPGGHGNALQYSCLENPMARGAW